MKVLRRRQVYKHALTTLSLFVFLTVFARVLHANVLTESVVKIFVNTNSYDYYQPWKSHGTRSSTGSGFILDKNTILTNAHVVSDATFIQVRKESSPKKYTAKLNALGNDCDLAILTVDDPTFESSGERIKFGQLPRLRDKVTVVGFPRGGDKLSITEGVVSRVEVISYAQSTKKLLSVQIDAAVNPGNSGGPVYQNNTLVGIAMQVISNSQNIGFMIPVPIINHFLKDLEDGRYDGFPILGIEYNNTENNSLRNYYKVQDLEGGVVVNNVYPFSPAHNVLKARDIILEVDSIPIGMDGTFDFRDNERLSFAHLINEKQIGSKVKFKIVRDGKTIEKTVVLNEYVGLVPPPKHFRKPSYYIYGGLVFTVLSVDLLTTWGKKWWEKSPVEFLDYLMGRGRMNEDGNKEMVVLLNVLPDDINVGYHQYSNEVITKFNGESFHSFKEFVKLLEINKESYSIFETDHKVQIILKSENITSITQDILERNNIPARYSSDVAEWLKE